MNIASDLWILIAELARISVVRHLSHANDFKNAEIPSYIDRYMRRRLHSRQSAGALGKLGRLGVRGGKRQRTGEHLIEGDAEGVEITAEID